MSIRPFLAVIDLNSFGLVTDTLGFPDVNILGTSYHFTSFLSIENVYLFKAFYCHFQFVQNYQNPSFPNPNVLYQSHVVLRVSINKIPGIFTQYSSSLCKRPQSRLDNLLREFRLKELLKTTSFRNLSFLGFC